MWTRSNVYDFVFKQKVFHKTTKTEAIDAKDFSKKVMNMFYSFIERQSIGRL